MGAPVASRPPGKAGDSADYCLMSYYKNRGLLPAGCVIFPAQKFLTVFKKISYIIIISI